MKNAGTFVPNGEVCPTLSHCCYHPIVALLSKDAFYIYFRNRSLGMVFYDRIESLNTAL